MTDTAAKLPEIEHIKARKDGLDVLADIYRYAELGFDAIEPDDLALFRWYGVYTQRAAESAASGDPGPSEQTDGLFMLRVKFPGGIVSSEQLRAVGSLAERYGRGMGDITTRQNIQLHNLAIEDMPIVLDELNAVGLSFTQACGDVWRNVVGCPLAGVDGHELIDTRPLVADLERAFVGHREFSNLPRKFKVSVSACVHHCAQHEINDIGLVAVDKDGVIGYDVWVGGGLGASAKMGRRLDVFARPEQAVEVCRAITELYRDEGKRTKRTRARIKFLVDEWGVERLRDEVERKLGYELERSVAPTAPIDPHRDHLGVHPQAQPGLYYVGGTTLRGRFTADQMIGVAGIAERYGSGELRCTNRQNIIVVDVPDQPRRDGRRRARRPGPAHRGVGVPARHHLLHRHGVLQARDRRDQAPRGGADRAPGAAHRRPGRIDPDQPERLPERLRPVPDRRHRPAGRDRQDGRRRAGAGLHRAHRRPAGGGGGLRAAYRQQGDPGR